MKLALIIFVVVSFGLAKGTRYPLFHLKSFGTDPYSDERVGVIHDWTTDTTAEADPTIWDFDPNFPADH